MNIKVLYVALSLLVVGCKGQYGIANFAHEGALTPKPTYRDSTATSKYIGGSLYRTFEGDQQKEYNSITMGSLEYTVGQAYKFASIGYGGFIHGGNYNAKRLDLDAGQLMGGHKYFVGGGLTSEASLNIPFKFVDWRIIGVKFTALYENGEYAKFRKDAVDFSKSSENSEIGFVEVVDLNPNDYSFNLSITTEMVFKLNQFDAGFWTSLGVGHQFFTASTGLRLSSQHYSFSVQQVGSIQGTYTGMGISYILR